VILLSESYSVDIRGLFDTMVAEQPEDRAAEPWHANAMRATTGSTTVRAVIEARGPRERLQRANGTLGESVSLTVLAADLKQHKVAGRVSRNEEVVVGSAAPQGDEVSYQVETEITLRPGVSIGPVVIGAAAGTARIRPSLNRVFQQTDVLTVVYGLLVPSRAIVTTTVEIIDGDGWPVVTERRDVGAGAQDPIELSLRSAPYGRVSIDKRVTAIAT
jgi:hypothetical protein